MLRREIWNQLLDAERLVRYYSKRTQRYNTFCWIMRSALWLLYIGGISAYLEFAHLYVSITLAVVLAVATVLNAVLGYDEKAATLKAISSRSNRLLDQWRDLWLETQEGIVEDDILRMKYRYLRDEQTASTEWAVFSGIPEDDELGKKAAKEAFKVVELYSHSEDKEIVNG